MTKRAKRITIGTISHGTMCPEDLIPAFVWELEQNRPLPLAHRKLLRKIEAAMKADGYFDSENALWDLDSLFDALTEYAPDYFYFGSHPGDGSDYGYWLSDEWERELEDNGGIKVNDISDIPHDHVGHVAVISDHGNVTMYRRSRDHKLTELWSIV